MIYANPNTEGSLVQFKERYENFIGGEWIAPVKGQYLEVKSPLTGKVFTSVARSTEEDIELALDAAHAAKDAWAHTSVAYRANILNKIADLKGIDKDVVNTTIIANTKRIFDI